MDGVKYDQHKDRWDLLPMREVREVIKVLTFGAQKYDDDNWKKVPDIDKRYFAAAMRHMVAYHEGKRYDEESGLNHLAHAMCCMLFMLWFDNEGKRNETTSKKKKEEGQEEREG